MEFYLKINGKTELSFTANNQEELDKQIARVEKVVRLNRFCYKNTNLIVDKNGLVIYQI